MPEDVPLDEHQRLMTAPADGADTAVAGREREPAGDRGGNAVARHSAAWTVYFAVVVVAVAVAVLGQTAVPAGNRGVAVTAIALIAVAYGLRGRRPQAGSPFVAGILLIFGVGAAAVPVTGYLLFALCPMIFLILEIRAAIVAVVAANLLPLAGGLHRDGVDWSFLAHQAPVSGVTAAAGVWLGVWIDRIVEQSKERAALIAELESSRAEVARLSHEAGVAAERARLAGEIHDTLAQGFTSIVTLLQAADPELADERLALAVRTARENLAESRALVAALAPAALASGSLPDAVRRQVNRFAEETGLAAAYRLSGDTRALPTAVEVVLLRAAQEALANVRRHAGAHEVAVLLAYAADSVRLVVRDDGRGFDATSAAGFGLPGMRARAAQVNGTLTVRSDPDTGTLIEVEVPA
ncbi:sensor histidine kinase [Amorphoplanes nipponensis]|uniref:histidine kinase n=1 Tax=Actinoplanes nipponensis TaxID=135950 RepID=A0A919JE01_9ACTN|nr:sensor histidine kinase [Actinoplanes nipponensis]GIE47822.1 two-component sensor histidine kinase [Actinoplanes nipponensis]